MKVFLCLQYDFAGIAAKSEILVNSVSWEIFFVIANYLKKKSPSEGGKTSLCS